MYRFDEVWDYLSEIRCFRDILTICIIYIDLETVSWIANLFPFFGYRNNPQIVLAI